MRSEQKTVDVMKTAGIYQVSYKKEDGQEGKYLRMIKRIIIINNKIGRAQIYLKIK